MGDARAESPGESIARLYLYDLRRGPVELQVRVPGPQGTVFEVDMEFCGVLAEFDGAVKYSRTEFLRGRTPEQVVLDEKRREDWIRGSTGKRMIRFGTPELADRDTFARYLSSLGIRPRRVTT
ncbi:MAG: hypothetical protein QM607_05170 [Microbacterium sp.]